MLAPDGTFTPIADGMKAAERQNLQDRNVISVAVRCTGWGRLGGNGE